MGSLLYSKAVKNRRNGVVGCSKFFQPYRYAENANLSFLLEHTARAILKNYLCFPKKWGYNLFFFIISISTLAYLAIFIMPSIHILFSCILVVILTSSPPFLFYFFLIETRKIFAENAF